MTVLLSPCEGYQHRPGAANPGFVVLPPCLWRIRRGVFAHSRQPWVYGWLGAAQWFGGDFPVAGARDSTHLEPQKTKTDTRQAHRETRAEASV